MKNLKTVCLFALILSSKMFAQAPFTTLVKLPVVVEENNGVYEMVDIESKLVSERNSFVAANSDQEKVAAKLVIADAYQGIIDKEKNEETKNTVGFFKNSSLALSVLDKAENRASISAQVVFYNIGIATPVETNPKNYRYNIPMMIIAKLSTSYDSISGTSAIDVLDYEAAPVTLRIMPSWKLNSNKKYKEQFLFGFYADARGINIQNSEADDYSLEIVGSAGVGFTVTGEGEAGIYNKEGNYEKGNWLVSAMFQGAIGDKKVIQKLFNTEKDYVTSFQTYFAFNISEESKFNLKIGYQHFFKETIAGTKNNFSIAIGI